MLKTPSARQDAGIEPAPDFANDADISLAEQLRLQVEERYFGRTVTPMVLLARPEKNH